MSIKSSTFSTLWKPQLIFPSHKKSDKSLIENYRPVSHLVEIRKLVEYEIFDQVLGHFLDNSLFHENHHGGLPDHSTTTALIQLNNMFLEDAHAKKFPAALQVTSKEALNVKRLLMESLMKATATLIMREGLQMQFLIFRNHQL